MYTPLTPYGRRCLLDNYMATEDTITVNTEDYRISFHEAAQWVYFCACNVRNHLVGAITFIIREQWERIETGLGMAYAYNAVLDSLEKGVVHSGGYCSASHYLV